MKKDFNNRQEPVLLEVIYQKRLLDEGNEVICLDNFFTGSKDNIRDLISNANFELVRHDVTKEYFAEADEISTIWHVLLPRPIISIMLLKQLKLQSLE